MVKADEIRAKLGPRQPQSPRLEQAERLERRRADDAATAADAARIASQAGFSRTPNKKRGVPDIGDSSGAPAPLPDDEAAPRLWTLERLDGAQESLGLASARLGEVARGIAAAASLGASVAGGSFLSTEEGIARMRALADRPAPRPVALDQVATDVDRLFRIELDRDLPVGHGLLAAGLVVAGEADSLAPGDGALDERKLARGLRKVTERGNQAVGRAREMAQGILRELSAQRTFVLKR